MRTSGELGPAADSLQRRIKEVFDPRGILNPGKAL
ncbi:FAD-linked oxidase C-terminal domain-containing protein [Streptomyces sp. NPDC005374]